ncbi:MAG TPA: DUF5107 domain-containing protein, partial [Phycisphaerae bacterium]|nr:DUF5107 domain-containing protein [Phycisphaerae bacterium]
MPGFTLPDPPEPLAAKPVRAWSQPVVIPTYEPMPADKNPMFLEKRGYQGSSGKVYPLPFIDRIATTKTDRAWQAIHIENQYVRLMILPELGGRIHVGLDKTNNYDFFYRQNVIKPALVGLAGPWISGGVEFNWPQHHRPSTFMPVDTHIEEHADGSVTVWCSEHEPMTRMKGMHGIHLKPGSSLIELKVRLYNRTELPQTFLWWANVAARVHEHYQSFFPPDVQYVADHAKRAMSRFPLCDGTYYGVDYESVARRGNARQNASPANEPSDYFQGTAPHFPPANYPPNDLTRYANIPVPTSYMILGTKEDFFGGYDHHAQAGFVHVADHHIAPGKKQWTWGNHPFGYAWDRHLTDPEDPTDTAPPYRRHLPAPYIELMAGVFTDNQPDFSWLMPGETRTFSQFWYPIQKIGPVIAANQQCAMSLIALESSNRMTDPPSRGSGDQKVAHDKPTAVGAVVGAIPNSPGEPRQGRQNASSLRAIAIKIGLVVTTKLSNARLTLHHAHDTIAEWPNLELAPGQPVFHEAPIPDGVHLNDLQISLHANHHEILSYQPAPPTKKETPEPAQEPPLPQDAKTNEDLYLIGLHLDQYRHATRMPEDYWREALKRDPHDSRCNNALGLYHLRRGEFEKAVTHFQTAIASLTQYNPNPRDGEVFYNLGITLRHLRRTDEAYEAFGKAQWNETWKASACFAMAEIDWSSSRDNRGKQALANVNKTLHAQPDHLQARHLKIEIIGLGAEESNAIRDQTRRLDPLDSAGQSEPECGWQTVLDSVYDLLKSRNLQDAYILMMRAGLPQANMSGDLDNPLGEWRKPPQIGGEHEVGVTPMIWYLAAFIWGFWEKGDPLQQDRARR